MSAYGGGEELVHDAVGMKTFTDSMHGFGDDKIVPFGDMILLILGILKKLHAL